jgi:hypothetical protein
MVVKPIIQFLCFCAISNVLRAQDFSARWHYHVPTEKSEQGSYCGNAEKGVFAAFRNSSKLQIEGKEWLSSSSEKVVLASFDSFGRFQWQKPVMAAGNVMPAVCPMVADEKYLVAISSSNKSYWAIDGDTAYGSGVFTVDKQGAVHLIKSMPGSIASSPMLSVTGKYLIKCNVLKSDTVDGNVYSPGFWVIEMDRLGNITRKVRLGISQANYAEFAVVANDTNIVVAGYASRNRPFLGSGWQVRALDSISRPGGNSSDLFVACLNNQGNLKWIYRIDTMSYGTSAQSMVLMANGNLLWTPTYFKSGEFLGKAVKVRFPGGGYPMFIAINMDGGAIFDFRAPEMVAGGTIHGVKLFTDDKFRHCIIACRGGDSTGNVFGISPSTWESFFTGLLYCDSNFKFTHKAAVPEFTFSVVNAHNLKYLVYPVSFSFGSLGATLILDGVTYTNKLGNDVIAGSYTTEKFTRLGSVRKVKSSELLLYPNPAQQEFEVLNKQPDWRKASVFDLQGRRCGELTPVNGHWDVGHLPAGVYLLQFVGENSHMASSRLLINR